MSNGVASQLRTAISTIRDKSSEVSNSDFLGEIAAGRVESAKSQIDFARNGVQRNEMLLDDINSQLNPPPTKEVSSGKGETKTVVDQEEVRKLEGQKKLAESQLNDSKTAVEEAEQEAQIAAMEALEHAGISKEKQSELESVISKIDSIKDQMAKGEEVTEDDIKGALGDLNKAMEGLESNGIIKESFLEPVEEDLKDILRYVENPAPSQETIPAEGTINRDLYDIGIKGNDNKELVDIMNDFAELSNSSSQGTSINNTQLQEIRDRYMDKREGFSSEQLSSSVISSFENSFDNLVETSESDVPKIRAEAGTAG